ncbi:MAG: hypothetical protein OXH15_06670 [Gammaproteobacteria bacterium]|nr:hypothetical protein [Gammaproteobacteria bacterium]
MAVQYRGTLNHLRAQDVEIRLSAFGIQEGYSTGWSGTGVVVGNNGDKPLTPGGMMSAVMASGVVAGAPMSVDLEIEGGTLHGTNVRTWPCVVSGLRPYPINEFSAGCELRLLDPVSYLAEQPIWGAYRSVSVAEAVGGALSLAAGGDGKPSTAPILPALPQVRIDAEYRHALNKLPYVLATGQTLGDWLAEVLATLGLRAELRGHGDGRLTLTLNDAKPRRLPLEMALVTPDGVDPPSSDTMGPIMIQGHSAFPGAAVRGGLLDDPTKGSARPLLRHGAVGAVVTDSEVDVDEATGRLIRAARGTYSEMLMLTAFSRQPGIRPGELVRLSRPTHGLTDWQVTSVTHRLRGSTYDNDATMIRGDMAWHPDLPFYRPPVYVSAMVDGGDDFDFHQPVPRDRLGRIKVVFPFTPTPLGEEADEVAVADADSDGRVTLADFDDAQVREFTDNAAQWEEERAKYDAGEYNDPYPGKADAELTVDENDRRLELKEKRDNAIAYGAFQKASAFDGQDADRDGVVSSRDELVSDDLRAALRDEQQRRQLQEAWDDRHDTAIEAGSLEEEYGQIFGDGEDVSDDVLAARADAEEAVDRWPPRISLPVVKPMAGALHGFIVAHRHGDTCRVAVHSPFNAEIVGFQYRDDRRINDDLSRSVAGLVVEHNYAQAWSGFVFRRAEDMDDQATGSGGDADDDVDATEGQTADVDDQTAAGQTTDDGAGKTPSQRPSAQSGNVRQQPAEDRERLSHEDLQQRPGSQDGPPIGGQADQAPQGSPPPGSTQSGNAPRQPAEDRERLGQEDLQQPPGSAGAAPIGGRPDQPPQGSPPPSGDPPSGGPPSGDPPSGGPPSGGPPSGGPQSGNPPSGGPPSDDPPSGGPPSGSGPPSGDPPPQ